MSQGNPELLGKLYISDGENFKEVGPTKEVTLTYDNGRNFFEVTKEDLTLSAKLTHKEFYYKRKGKRYVRYYEIKDGISEKIWRKLIGE